MSDRFDTSSAPGSTDVEHPEPRLMERHRRARRLADQSWREFLFEFVLRTILVIVGVGLAVLALLALYH